MRIQVRQRRVHNLLRRWLSQALKAVDPAAIIGQQVKKVGSCLIIDHKSYHLHPSQKVVIVGAGKGSARMAKAMETCLGDRISSGVVVTKYGHRVPTKFITIREAGHPIPDRAGQSAGQEILRIVGNLTKQDLLLVLLSGGASSLLTAPCPGLTLKDIQRTTRLLLQSGATIQEINTVRKQVSAIKGGRLAGATSAKIVTLILSDVLGDKPEDIGSGPTAEDGTTYMEARSILQRYRLWQAVPVAIQKHILKGIRAKSCDSGILVSGASRRVQHTVLANNRMAVESVAQAAQRSGFHSVILTTSFVGEACEAAKWFGSLAREILVHQRPVPRPCCMIAGGELTVTRGSRGRGGRAQEFALAAALEIHGLKNVWVVAFGTDGTDGPTDVAGAVVDGTTVLRARRADIDLEKALGNHDSYQVLHRLRCQIITGPTGTNVNDLYLLLVL